MRYRLDSVTTIEYKNFDYSKYQQVLSCVGEAFEILLLQKGMAAYGVSTESEYKRFSTIGMIIEIDDSEENAIILRDNVGIEYKFTLLSKH